MILCENYRNIDFSVINKDRGNWVKVVIRSNSKTQRRQNKLDVIVREQRSKVRAYQHVSPPSRFRTLTRNRHNNNFRFVTERLEYSKVRYCFC